MQSNYSNHLFVEAFNLAKLSKHEEAIKRYKEIPSTDPLFVTARLNMVHSLMVTEQFPKAIRCCNDCIEGNGDNIQAYTYKGHALVKIWRFKDAIKSYDTAIEILNAYEGIRFKTYREESAKTYADILNGKGNALKGLGKYEEALDHYKIALLTDPKHNDASKNKEDLTKFLEHPEHPPAEVAVELFGLDGEDHPQN